MIYTCNGRVQMLINVRDIALDDILIKYKEVEMPIQSYCLKRTLNTSMDLAWQTAST